MAKKWKGYDLEQCPNCGDALEVLTESDDLGLFYDGDDCRCLGGCGALMSVTVGRRGAAWISWNNEETCPEP